MTPSSPIGPKDMEEAKELYQRLGRDAMLRQNNPVDTIAAALSRRERETIEKCAKALDARREYHEQEGCPDGDMGCCVLHLRTVSRVPMTREECKEAIRSLLPQGPAEGGGK